RVTASPTLCRSVFSRSKTPLYGVVQMALNNIRETLPELVEPGMSGNAEDGRHQPKLPHAVELGGVAFEQDLAIVMDQREDRALRQDRGGAGRKLGFGVADRRHVEEQ